MVCVNCGYCMNPKFNYCPRCGQWNFDTAEARAATGGMDMVLVAGGKLVGWWDHETGKFHIPGAVA